MPDLTDVRSSGLVRIVRSTGDLTLPASVRMLFLTNPETEDSEVMRPIIAYPNGIEIIKPLIGSIEDIARFDFIYILPDTPSDIDPLWTPPDGFTEEQLRTRIQWVWSRKEDQVHLSTEVQQYIVEMSKKLNEKYLCSIKIFSTETWKKVARMSIAIAGYMVSTNMSFDTIMVQKKHVDIACLLLESIYNNDTFKLKEFVTEERKTHGCELTDIKSVEELVTRYPSMLGYLESHNNVAKNTLYTIAGLDQLVFNEAIQRMSKESLVSITRDKIFPTPKLLIALKKVRAMKET
jgi:hypothetical protein